jgi:hypothetical protein
MKSHLVIFLFVIVACGCKSNERSGPPNPGPAPTATAAGIENPPTPAASSAAVVKSKVDVCNLLTSDELKSAQGEAYREAQRSDRQDGDFIIAQCYYQMPTMVNSVVLNVTSAREGAAGRNPREFWEETFREADEADRKDKNQSVGEREKQKPKAKDRREGEEEEGLPPERIKGLGDEAFWTASRVGGALYVLKQDQFFRISIGGPGDAQAKLNKSKMLAQSILKKL